MKKVFFDTETSGFTPGQIGQLSAIIEEDGKVTPLNYFFKMDYITQGAQDVCGRDLKFYEEASEGKIFADYAQELLQVFNSGILIAHNIKFDENFLSTEFWRQNIILKPENRFDTMEYFRDICKLPGRGSSKYKNPKLEELVDHFNINKDRVAAYTKQLFNLSSNESFHDARYDTTSLYVAFQVYNDIRQGTDGWINQFVNR